MICLKEKSSKFLKLSVALILLLSFVIAAFAGCSEEATNESAADESSVQAEASAFESSTVVDESKANVSSEAENVESSSEEGEESMGEYCESSETDEADESSSDPDESSEPESETSSEESIEPEIIGEGTKDSPFLVFPDKNMVLTTYEIGADETQYYAIYRIGGLNVTVESEDLYIVCDGKKNTPQNGELKFRVYSAMASEAIVFEITNTSTEKQAFSITFANPVGTFANPVSIELGKEQTVALEKNDDVGYYYKHIVEKDGVIKFKLTATKDGFLAVTNNRSYAQRTTDSDGTDGENGEKYVEIEVQKGDELIINVGAVPNARGARPAIEITVSAENK